MITVGQRLARDEREHIGAKVDHGPLDHITYTKPAVYLYGLLCILTLFLLSLSLQPYHRHSGDLAGTRPRPGYLIPHTTEAQQSPGATVTEPLPYGNVDGKRFHYDSTSSFNIHCSYVYFVAREE